MRRQDRELCDLQSLLKLIDECKVFRVALCVDNEPYIVPLNFAWEYQDGQFLFYFHSAKEGQKIEMIKKNPQVCFEMDAHTELTPAPKACGYGYNYQSIIGRGKAHFITEIAEKQRILSLLMKQQAQKDCLFSEKEASSVTLCQIITESLTAKSRQNPQPEALS